MAMLTEGTFRELIDRVRSGDEQAAIDLVRCYEPAIRRAARVRRRIKKNKLTLFAILSAIEGATTITRRSE
jgi:hypothetical protein